jgi:bacillithiol biosynthesis deacetylase BshB1
MEPVDILAFGAHPDDAELGGGGSLLLAADQGLRTAITDLSEGECSSRGDREQRRAEKQRAAELLGLADRYSLDLPDTRIGSDSDQRLPIIELIRLTRPRLVLAPYWVDRHPDHEHASQLVRAACYYAGLAQIGRGRPHRPARIYFYMGHTPFTPSLVVDISGVWDRKKAAIEAYGSQFTAQDRTGLETALCRPEFLRAKEAQAIHFGAMIGVACGEPFFSPGPVACRHLPGLERLEPLSDNLPPYCLF